MREMSANVIATSRARKNPFSNVTLYHTAFKTFSRAARRHGLLGPPRSGVNAAHRWRLPSRLEYHSRDIVNEDGARGLRPQARCFGEPAERRHNARRTVRGLGRPKAVARVKCVPITAD